MMSAKNEFNNYAFIDGENLYKSIRSQGWKLDYYKFRIYLKEKYSVSRAFLFIGYIKEKKVLYKSLKKSGFELVYKPTIKKGDGETKGNVDAELVLKTMIELNNFNKAIIITGDGDFCCLVKYLIEIKKLKILMIPDRINYSALFREFRKDIIYMNELREKLRYKKRWGVSKGQNL